MTDAFLDGFLMTGLVVANLPSWFIVHRGGWCTVVLFVCQPLFQVVIFGNPNPSDLVTNLFTKLASKAMCHLFDGFLDFLGLDELPSDL